MDLFLTKTAFEQTLFVKEAAARTGKSAVVIEKDFWVCWILGQIFALPEIGEHLTFKGGTSLSKAYGLIQRFSEDVDISFHREFLGFGSGNDPADPVSGKERKARLEGLQEACIKIIRERFVPELEQQISREFAWENPRFEIDAANPQVVFFHYPKLDEISSSSYIRPFVKIEMGARSDHWPVERKEIRSYVSEAFPEMLLNSGSSEVTVLGAERTFWEKATILHAEFHRPAEKAIPDRQSRHYSDLAEMALTDVAERAKSQIDLLLAVAEHKNVFFKSAWAKYDEARPGLLRLAPPASRIGEIEHDYAEMAQMFFGTPRPFTAILETLSKLDQEINGAA